MNIIDIFIISVSISMILYYVYETDFIWEYLNKVSDILNLNLFNKIFNGILLLKAYPNSDQTNYLQFLNATYNSFITRLISCPICSGFWVCIIFGLFSNMKFVFVYGFASLVMYYLIKILTKLSAKL